MTFPDITGRLQVPAPTSRYILPNFEERTSYGMKRMDPYTKLFEDRIIFLGVQVDDASADDVIAQLIVLESQDPDRDILMYINSPGGSFTAMAADWGLTGDTRWRGLDVGSPFDYPKSGILYVAAHLPPPGRDGTGSTEQLEEMAGLIGACGGRTLGLFSSIRAARAAAEVGHYFESGQTYGLASAQAGRSFRMNSDNGRAVLFPHAVAE